MLGQKEPRPAGDTFGMRARQKLMSRVPEGRGDWGADVWELDIHLILTKYVLSLA